MKDSDVLSRIAEWDQIPVFEGRYVLLSIESEQIYLVLSQRDLSKDAC